MRITEATVNIGLPNARAVEAHTRICGAEDASSGPHLPFLLALLRTPPRRPHPQQSSPQTRVGWRSVPTSLDFVLLFLGKGTLALLY
jgi:hypothetical protein